MILHEYLAKARQHDAQRAGDRDRLIQKARQGRTARRHRAGPAARARRLARLIFRRAPPGEASWSSSVCIAMSSRAAYGHSRYGVRIGERPAPPVGKLIVASADAHWPPGRESTPLDDDRMPTPADLQAMRADHAVPRRVLSGGRPKN
jgi:hypothetical protein